MYVSAFKQNSATSFNQKEERFSIIGSFNGTKRVLVREKSLDEFRASRKYEYCLPKTRHLIYTVELLDTNKNGWDDGSYIEFRSATGFLLFKGSCHHGEKEVYRIRRTPFASFVS